MTNMTRRKALTMGAAALVTMGAAGLAMKAGGAAAQQPASLLAAEKEGRINWYTLPGWTDQMKDALAEWKKRHPKIEISILEATGPDLLERIRAEQRVGRVVADVVTLGDLAAWGFALKDGFTPFDKSVVTNLANVEGKFAHLVDTESRYLPIGVHAYGINVNTRVLPEKDHPKRWKDLLAPKYAKRIGVHDFGRIGGGLAWFMVASAPDALGTDFFTEFVKQEPRVSARFQENDAALVRGESAIGVPGQRRTSHDYEGAPIKWIVPEEGIFVISLVSGVVRGGEHPNASNLFLNFLLDKPFQQGIASVRDLPIVRGVSSGLDLAQVKLLGRGSLTIADQPRLADMAKRGRELLGRQ